MDKKIVIVYAPAHNDICIPVTVYPDIEFARKDLTEKLGFEPVVGNYPAKLIWKLPESEEEIHGLLVPNIFTEYYGGCGECYKIIAREILPGEAIFAFNLD